ncbi:MAG: (2Fe-2S)-binding protein [Pseudomonadota bacterium]
MKLKVNHQIYDVPAAWQEDVLLFVLREVLGLVGPKFGCGAGQCGACSVLIDGQAQRSCLLPVKVLSGQHIETIEGLSKEGDALHPVQQAWVDEAVPQCGFCQAGQIMSATALLRTIAHPTDEQINAAMSGNLCRCGTQQRIRQAIHRAAEAIQGEQA